MHPPDQPVPTGNTYDKYGASNPVARRLVAGFFRDLERLLPTDARRVLEVGVGEGEVLQRVADRYPSASRIGLDLPDPELRAQWRTRGLTTVEGDGAALPFPDRSFDLVLAIEVLEHVDPVGPVLDELVRVADGALVASVPREPIWRASNLARGRYLSRLGNTPGHVNHWSSRSFVELVSARLSVEAVERPFPWTMVRARRPG